MLVDPNNALFSGLIRAQEHQRPLVEAIRRITGKPYKVGIFKKGLDASVKKAAQADEMDELLNNANRAGIPVKED